ncbi:hypothetical protein EYC80_008136 [Monilinia laxa]|uniref:Uncharacterized protein n=1 Tax=Monilinia laxa TaxID=61186 RepID=A0A5N6JTK3_MONLA|nr:hypothetical protein EYC80_008136 [Monilinia laxa]
MLFPPVRAACSRRYTSISRFWERSWEEAARPARPDPITTAVFGLSCGDEAGMLKFVDRVLEEESRCFRSREVMIMRKMVGSVWNDLWFMNRVIEMNLAGREIDLEMRCHVKSGLCVGNWNIVCINADNISLTRGVLLFVPTMIMQWRVLFALVIEGNYSTKQ